MKLKTKLVLRLRGDTMKGLKLVVDRFNLIIDQCGEHSVGAADRVALPIAKSDAKCQIVLVWQHLRGQFDDVELGKHGLLDWAA